MFVVDFLDINYNIIVSHVVYEKSYKKVREYVEKVLLSQVDCHEARVLRPGNKCLVYSFTVRV